MKYKTNGTCASEIVFEVDANDVITDVKFIGGCKGNTQGVATLAIGRKADEVAKLLKGIQCHGGTSCPDQLSKALEEYLNNK